MPNPTPHPTRPEVHEATLRVDAAAALLARGLLDEAPLVDCAESAAIWLDQAARWLERSA
jgi:hypothetical protein